MELSNDLLYLIGKKTVWNLLQDKFKEPIEILNGKIIDLATKWSLLDQFEIRDETMVLLAHYGHFETVKWLYQHGLYLKPHTKAVMYEADWSDYPIDMAAASGHLDIVEWLYFQGEGFSTFAMDYAAMNGHLSVVKWLYSKGGSCTSLAFDGAAGSGNLEMVKWLHENCPQGFSRTIYKNNDDLKPIIYKFIIEKYPLLFHPKLIVNVARYGDVETLRQIYSRNGQDWKNFSGTHPNGIRFWYTTFAYVEAGKCGHLPVVQWFIEKKLIV